MSEKTSVKDVGFVGVDGGWEIYVAGNGGTELRAADLLAKVKTEAEVMDLTGAFLQYYRETALYLERTSKWVERVGLDVIKETLKDETTRMEFNKSLEQTIQRYVEPWKQAVDKIQIQEEYYLEK